MSCFLRIRRLRLLMTYTQAQFKFRKHRKNTTLNHNSRLRSNRALESHDYAVTNGTRHVAWLLTRPFSHHGGVFG